MYKKTYYELTMSYVYLHTCLAILQTINWVQGIQNLVLNGTGPLKLLHLYGNLAIVMTTSNKLVAEPRQACMSPCKGSYMPVCALQL